MPTNIYVFIQHTNIKTGIGQTTCLFDESSNQNQIKSNYFIVRLKVDQRAGQLSLPHLGITKTKNITKT